MTDIGGIAKGILIASVAIVLGLQIAAIVTPLIITAGASVNTSVSGQGIGPLFASSVLPLVFLGALLVGVIWLGFSMFNEGGK